MSNRRLPVIARTIGTVEYHDAVKCKCAMCVFNQEAGIKGGTASVVIDIDLRARIKIYEGSSSCGGAGYEA